MGQFCRYPTQVRNIDEYTKMEKRISEVGAFTSGLHINLMKALAGIQHKWH
jgi:hypothetical protein